MFTHFKNDSIRKLVVGFGSLFNGIKLLQKDENNNDRLFEVPLVYGPKEKFIKRLTEPSSISDRTRIQLSLPRISFELLGLLYDPTRKLNKLNQKIEKSGVTLFTNYAEVPYNFTFGLNVYTRNFDENLQIMEQILPYFSPEFIVSLKMNNLHENTDVPISIFNSTLTQEYEGDFSVRRFIVSSYQFVAKSYVYGPIKNDGVYDITNIAFNILDNVTGFTYDSFGITA